ncbi:acyl carrier protein [Rhodovulum bhavnagarense]|uniref:Acyl carrier protein n=1 Tax=Rhodovulum bhavnagarense TaxID=992286 RepID=A0A4R2RKS8_9RHOB|nr:phosphopantetheine-binding protein [Rhodovulum bhavnagarense]TCP63428.1 acyl carrier protein [Rhodovulum bhavnagarense]
MDAAKVRALVQATLEEFIEDWGLEAEIKPETRIVEDLEFDSIDVIQLTVAIESALGGRKLGFQDLLMRDGRYIDDLSLREVQDFVAAKIAA